SADQFQPLLAKAQQDGTVRAIVGVQVHWTAEGLLSETDVLRQRDELTAARDALLATLQGQRYRVLFSYRTLPLVALELSPSAVDALERGGRVARIEEDRGEFLDLAQSVPLIEANETSSLNFGGQGETIAILDSGVDAGHPFLGGRVVAGCDVANLGPACSNVQGDLSLAGPCTYSALCQHG